MRVYLDTPPPSPLPQGAGGYRKWGHSTRPLDPRTLRVGGCWLRVPIPHKESTLGVRSVRPSPSGEDFCTEFSADESRNCKPSFNVASIHPTPRLPSPPPLRGRVGRGVSNAFSYTLTPKFLQTASSPPLNPPPIAPNFQSPLRRYISPTTTAVSVEKSSPKS